MDINSLATTEEIKEVNVALQSQVRYIPTFVMADTQYYRIVSPVNHPHYRSDMTMEGMKEWKVIA